MIIEISTVSLHDKALITANYKYHLEHEKYNCESKWYNYEERNNCSWDEVEKYFKLNRGCFGGKPNTLRKLHGSVKAIDTSTNICGIKYESCLCNYKHKMFNFYYELFNKYEANGLLPFDGCITDQPSYIIDIFSILKAVRSEHEYKLQLQQQQQNKLQKK